MKNTLKVLGLGTMLFGVMTTAAFAAEYNLKILLLEKTNFSNF